LRLYLTRFVIRNLRNGGKGDYGGYSLGVEFFLEVDKELKKALLSKNNAFNFLTSHFEIVWQIKTIYFNKPKNY